MLFNSIQFVIFFIVVFVLYYSLPNKFRWYLLLASSIVFYCFWIPIYLFYLAYLIIIDYFAALLLESTTNLKYRRILLIASLLSNFGLLFYFKYFNFFGSSANSILQFFNFQFLIPHLQIILPLGISFHVFQSVGYVIDVYKKKINAEKSFQKFALFVMFFPQLVAGPIERAGNLLPQFGKYYAFNYEKIIFGLRLMLWGYFKKIVIADSLAPFVNQIYAQPTEFQGFPLIVATVFFAFQVYGDFSGYSDIARGAAYCLGIDLTQNFKRPFFSHSILELWKRWNISMTQWFRDYIYIPLGGNRVSTPRWCYNILITFFLSGLWHGANWTFALWGTLHGGYIVFSDIIRRIWGAFQIHCSTVVKNIFSFLSIPITFFFFCIAVVFFRAQTFGDALHIITHSNPLLLSAIVIPRRPILLILLLLCIEYFSKSDDPPERLNGMHIVVRWLIYLAMIMAIILSGTEAKEFIYFNF